MQQLYITKLTATAAHNTGHNDIIAVMLNQAKTSRPSPELRGRGQFLEVEAKAKAKNNYAKKYQMMINNIQFKIIAGKINKIPEFYTTFARKMPDYIIRQPDRGQAEAKCLRLRPKFWPRGHFGLEDLTSLHYSAIFKKMLQ